MTLEKPPEIEDITTGEPPTHQRPVIRNAILLVLFLAVVLVGVITVLLPALDEGTENDPNAPEEVASEGTETLEE